jgi:FOG: PKD repeat
MSFTDTGLAPGSSHTYALRVTDPDGNTISRTGNTVVVAGGGSNQPPVASFSYGTNGLTVNVNGSASTDPDGTIASYAWTFGDGGTATGATAAHTYAAAGTYTVTLTVTDNGGATNSLSKSVTVSAAGVVAQDNFARTTASGWGSATTGGAWTVSGTAASYTVTSGTANMKDAAGSSMTASLGSVSSSRTDTTVGFTTDVAPTGGGLFVSALARQVGSVAYEGRAWISSSGAVQVQLLQSGTTLTSAVVGGLTYSPGTQLNLRVQAVGTSPTTLQAKVWPATQAEPASWQVSLTDSTAALQSFGSVGLRAYLSGAATVSPVTVKFSGYQVVAVP